jgi:4-hydroxy-tetrahydrodipicolinate synthase
MGGRFGAVVTAMATPFAEDGSLDLDGAQTLAAHLYEHGTDSIVVAGSTGESPTLTHAEKLDLFRAVVDVAKDKGQVIAGTGTYNTAETVELSAEAAACGVDGLLVVTPYYNKPPQRGLVAHFGKVAESTELPIIAYNIPSRTATRIEHETMLTLAAMPNIVGVKDSTGDLGGVSRLIREAPAGFEVYSGDDWAAFAIACLGGVGLVSVAAHLVGDKIAQMLHLVFDGDVPSARKIHEELSPLFATLFITSNPIPLKAALEVLGLPGGEPRLPLLAATPDERDKVRRTLEDAGLL